MLLELENFTIRMILLDVNNQISSFDISDKVKGFTSNNSAPVLGEKNMKYKIMFSDIEIPENTKFITFQISVKINDKYYNPYLFLPIKNNSNSDFSDGPGRAISYRLSQNKFSFIWMYFTHMGMDRILEDFSPESDITKSIEYLKEYIPCGIPLGVME